MGDLVNTRVSADLFRIAYACAGVEETRYYLTGVHIEEAPEGGALLVATDGHRLICIRDEAGWVREPVTVKLGKESLRLCKARKAKKNEPVGRHIIIDAANVTIADEDDALRVEHPVADAILDVTFPGWQRTVPEMPYEGTEIASFNAAYVASFAKIGAELGKILDRPAAMRMMVRATGESSLILWPEIPCAFGLLMPMRTDDVRAPTFDIGHAPPSPVEAVPVAEAA